MIRYQLWSHSLFPREGEQGTGGESCLPFFSYSFSLIHVSSASDWMGKKSFRMPRTGTQTGGVMKVKVNTCSLIAALLSDQMLLQPAVAFAAAVFFSFAGPQWTAAMDDER